MLKPFEIGLRHQIGVRNIMFSADYPHIEGTWPNTREWLRLIFKGVPENEVRLILGENAARIYNIDTAKLQPIVDRIGLDMTEILSDEPVSREFTDSFDFRSVFFSRPVGYDRSVIDPLLNEDQAAILAHASR
jgi:hypothetical protein